MFRERGGSSTFARHAFNELIAFIAGWAILIDYLIVIALAAISVPHYLEPISADLAEPGWEIGVAGAVIVAACVLNILNITGRGRERAAGRPRPRRPRPAAGGDRRRRARGLAPRPPHRPARPLHRPELQRHRLRGGGRDARLRRDRGRLRPRPRHRRRAARPEADRLARRDRGAARLRRDGGDRADGGAGGRRPARARRPRSAASSSRRRCSASSPPTTRPGSPTRCAGWSRWSPRRSCSGRRPPRCSASPATSTRWRSTARSPAGWASSNSRHATPARGDRDLAA